MLIRLVEEAQQRDFGQVYLHALNFYKKLGLSVTKKSILKVAYRMSWHA